MTNMGMAASQARFLGLTARKSNVEYQGQQINQQRTALSNESSNLYNQMLELNVPTPPSTSDYYTTSYTLEDSANGLYDDYTILSMTKTYSNSNQYRVTLSTQVESSQAIASTYSCSTSSVKDSDGNTLSGSYSLSDVASATIKLTDGTTSAGTLYYDSSNLSCLDEDGNIAISAWQIYEVSSDYASSLTGYSTCKDDLDAENEDDETYYFYQDSSGKNHYFTATQLEAILNGSNNSDALQTYCTNTYYKTQTVDVDATIEKSDTGRISTISILDDDGVNTSISSYLRGATFSVSTVTEMDQDAYDDAYNDYEYEKYLYEKEISDINAQTEVIQNQDQQLELRLEQLDTEQNAISTEMESVQKVIEDNIEKTFATFA